MKRSNSISTGALREGSVNWEQREALRKMDEPWWEQIFDRIAEGEKPYLVAQSMGYRFAIFLRVLMENEPLRAQYMRALEIATEGLMHDVVAIADGTGTGMGEVGKAKLRIDTRFRLAGKWNRERYGEHMEVKHEGQAGGVTILLSALGARDLEKLIAPKQAASVVEGQCEVVDEREADPA